MQLIASVTQGSQNTFAQTSINTGLSASLANGYRLDSIDLEWPDLSIWLAAGVEAWYAQLSRASKTAISTLADDDLLFKQGRSLFTNAAGITDTEQKVVSYVPSTEILLIEEVVFFGFNTLNVSGAQSAIIRLNVTPVKVSDAQRIAILQSRVN